MSGVAGQELALTEPAGPDKACERQFIEESEPGLTDVLKIVLFLKFAQI